MPFLHLKGTFGVVLDFAHALYRSQNLPYRSARRVIYFLIVVAALGHLVKLVVFAGTPPALFGSDIMQDYLMGRAIANDIDPRLPIPELGRRIFDHDLASGLPTGSAHSPLAALIFLPISLLPLDLARQLWVVFSAGCAFVSFFVLGNIIEARNRAISATLWSALSILSWPGNDDLFFGQWNFQQLLAISFFLNAYHRRRYISSAACLALSLAIRPVIVPLCLYFFIVTKGVFRRAFAIVCVSIILALISVRGIDAILSYPSTAHDVVFFWSSHWSNISLWSLVPNLVLPRFGEISSNQLVPILPVSLPEGYAAVGKVLAGGVALASLWRARGREPHYAMLSLIVISPVLSPLAWHHYLTFLFVPLFLDGQRLMRQPGVRSRLTLLALIVPLVYPASALFNQIDLSGSPGIASTVPISWIGKSVYPVLTLSVVLAWALYPLPKRVCGKNLSKGYDGSCP